MFQPTLRVFGFVWLGLLIARFVAPFHKGIDQATAKWFEDVVTDAKTKWRKRFAFFPRRVAEDRKFWLRWYEARLIDVWYHPMYNFRSMKVERRIDSKSTPIEVSLGEPDFEFFPL